MAHHPDILDQEDSLSRPVAHSMAAHVGVAALIAAWTFYNSPGVPFGDTIPGGGSGAITVTAASIPIPNQSPRLNDVARDTKAVAPSKPEKAAAKREDPDAIAIGKKDRKAAKSKLNMDVVRNLRRERQELEDNQVASSQGARASSPLFTVAGTGNIGVGDNSPLGGRFGGYVNLIRRCVGEKWREQRVDPTSIVSRPAIVKFVIHRAGEATNIDIAQSSGNLAVDRACQRAVESCSPFQPLPAQYERNTATVEFWFQLQK